MGSVIIIKSLVDSKILEEVFVKSVIGEKELKNRLMELGITKGTKIYIKRFAPFGSPIEILVRGYSLCLDIEKAKNILVV